MTFRASQVSRRFQPGNGGGLSAQEFRPKLLSGLAAWYRADQGITIATGVSQWNDLSGNGRNLTQATGGLQPAFVASMVNGKPGVRFDGTDDFFSPLTFSMATATYVIVAKANALFAAGTHDFLFVGGTGITAGVQWTNSNNSLISGGALNFGAAPSTATYGVYAYVHNGASSMIDVNGTQVSGDDGGAAADGFTLGALTGGTRSISADIPEVIIYSRALSASELARVKAYAKARYGL